MSGLLPHNPNNSTGGSSSGSFITLTVGSLIVTSFASVANLAVSGLTTLANLTVSGTTTFTNLLVSGTATISGALNGVAGVFSDVYSNYTAGSTVTLSTTGSNAAVLLSPNGTGRVAVKAGSALTADSLAPTTAGALAISTTSNGNLNLSTGAGIVALSCASFHPITVNNTSATSGSDILFQNNGTSVVGFGANQTTNEAYAFVFANQPFKIGTNGTERLRIDAAGIANNNAITNILGLSGTSLAFKNNVADTSTSQVFTNKTLDSASNTLTITNAPLAAANVNTLFNQALLTTSSPTFVTISAANANLTALAAGATFDLITKNGNVVQHRTDITNQQLLTTSSPTFVTTTSANANLTGLAAGATFDLVTKNGNSLEHRTDITNQQLLTSSSPTFSHPIVTAGLNWNNVTDVTAAAGSISAGTFALASLAIPVSTCYVFEIHVAASANGGGIAGFGEYRYSYRTYNNAGTLVIANGVSQDKSEANVVGAYTGKVAFSLTASGTTANLNIVSTLATTLNFQGLITIYK